MKTEFFLAMRYLRPRRSAVSIITLISIIGVILGVGVLIIVLAVMTGFTDIMKTKLLQTQAHFQIKSSYGNVVFGNPEHYRKLASDNGAVKSAALVISPVMVQNGKRLDVQGLAIGVNPDDFKDTEFGNSIFRGKAELKRREVIISYIQANRWQLDVGDRLLLHSPNRLTDLVEFAEDGSFKMNESGSIYLPMEFTVGAIYKMDKYDFDKSTMFIDIDDANELLTMPWGSATVIYGWVKDPFDMQLEIDAIEQALPRSMQISSWQKENRALLGVLNTEKNMMFFLLIFIVLVAAFSIANTLITSVYQKTREIGILKALGFTNGMVLKVFVLQGFLVGVIGSLGGVLLGGTVLYYRNDVLNFIREETGRDLFPPEFYFFNELPAHVVPGDVMLIVVSAVILCTLGAMLPAWRAAKMDPAKALRNE